MCQPGCFCLPLSTMYCMVWSLLYNLSFEGTYVCIEFISLFIEYDGGSLSLWFNPWPLHPVTSVVMWCGVWCLSVSLPLLIISLLCIMHCVLSSLSFLIFMWIFIFKNLSYLVLICYKDVAHVIHRYSSCSISLCHHLELRNYKLHTAHNWGVVLSHVHTTQLRSNGYTVRNKKSSKCSAIGSPLPQSE